MSIHIRQLTIILPYFVRREVKIRDRFKRKRDLELVFGLVKEDLIEAMSGDVGDVGQWLRWMATVLGSGEDESLCRNCSRRQDLKLMACERAREWKGRNMLYMLVLY